MDGLLDWLEDLVEIVAGAAHGHPERPIAVLADPLVLGADELTHLGVERTSLGAGLSEREPEQRDRGRHRQLEEV
ncbi:MAG TPA: hypothetical protein VF942_18870, partial [Acidimicrobiales bacterium]